MPDPQPDLETLQTIQQKIGYQFAQNQYLIQALDSKRDSHEAQDAFYRLVFLGESVLSLVLADRAFLKLLNLGPGALQRLRVKLMRDESCAEYLAHLQISEHYEMLKHFFDSLIQAERHKCTAEYFKALLAAIYLDGGVSAASKFFNRKCLPAAKPFIQDRHYFDWKRKLQDICHKYKKKLPTYRLIEEVGPEHNKIFKVGLYWGDRLIGKGEAKTKKKAANQAAFKGFEKIKKMFVLEKQMENLFDEDHEEPLSKTS